jgi:hypothetical protein
MSERGEGVLVVEETSERGPSAPARQGQERER